MAFKNRHARSRPSNSSRFPFFRWPDTAAAYEANPISRRMISGRFRTTALGNVRMFRMKYFSERAGHWKGKFPMRFENYVQLSQSSNYYARVPAAKEVTVPMNQVNRC